MPFNAIKTTSPSRRLAEGLMLVALGITLLTSPATAQSGGSGSDTSAPLQVCDPAFYTTLQNRGWAEAQRELLINNSTIKKPQSVLALSCFDRHIDQIDGGNGIFSNRYSPGGQDIAQAIASTQGSIFNDYMSSSFSEPTGSGWGGNSCDRIQKLWQAVKCEDSSATGMMSLASLQSAPDPRSTSGSTCPGSYKTPMGNALKGSGYIEIARANFCVIDPKTGKALEDGKICSADSKDYKCKDQKAVPTGLVVTYQGIASNAPLWSYRCINPGCYFDVKDNASKIKYEAGKDPPKDLTCSYRPYEAGSSGSSGNSGNSGNSTNTPVPGGTGEGGTAPAPTAGELDGLGANDGPVPGGTGEGGTAPAPTNDETQGLDTGATTDTGGDTTTRGTAPGEGGALAPGN